MSLRFHFLSWKSFTAVGLISFGVSLLSSPALANEIATFNFNKNIGKFWVGNINVEQGNIRGFTPNVCPDQGACIQTTGSSWEGEGIKISMPISVPSCPNQYHTEGAVTVKYTNGSAYVTRTLSIDKGSEGRNFTHQWTVKGYYGNPAQGHINVETNVDCVYHGVNGSGGSKWNPLNW